jgi:hypothetical protein
MHTRTTRPLTAALVGVTVAVLTACSGGGATEDTADASGSDGGSGSAVETDLRDAAAVVDEAMADYPNAASVVLSPTADERTFVYGAVEVPFTPSDATEDLTSSVTVSEGKYTISGTSADSGTTYTIDQDGEISEESA